MPRKPHRYGTDLEADLRHLTALSDAFTVGPAARLAAAEGRIAARAAAPPSGVPAGHVAGPSPGGGPAYDEAQHPRGHGGKWTSKGGGGVAPHPGAARPAGREATAAHEATRKAVAARPDVGQPSPGNKVGKPEQLYSAAQERRIAAALGARAVGRRNGKDQPMDALLRHGGTRHGIEIKAMSKGGKAQITMHADAELRKADYAEKRAGRVVHTVLVDHRDTYGGGAFAASYSGHELYYRRGTGPFKLAEMHKVKDVRELNRLVRAADADLPAAARAPSGWPPRGEARAKLEREAAVAHAGRLTRQRRQRAEKRGGASD